jgi:hypothetical protein
MLEVAAYLETLTQNGTHVFVDDTAYENLAHLQCIW